MQGKKVLFLCTGNYYRSRFAEALFNDLCRKSGLPHTADSSALAIELGACNVGPISRHTAEALAARGITLPANCRYPKSACDTDFESADLVIAVKELEHRPIIESRFSRFAPKVRYWHVHDLDASSPTDAMTQLDQLVRELFKELSAASVNASTHSRTSYST